MPNHVYNSITIDNEKDIDMLHKIADTGICEYFIQKPEVLSEYTSPERIVSEEEYLEAIEDRIIAKNHPHPTKYPMGLPMTEEIKKQLISKYGHTNWYDWCIDRWGTKWGAYDGMCATDTTYDFTSAWSPPHIEIIKMFAKVINNFSYNWEEEQGYGAEYIFKDSILASMRQWDLPNWAEVRNKKIIKHAQGHIITKLKNEPRRKRISKRIAKCNRKKYNWFMG